MNKSRGRPYHLHVLPEAAAVDVARTKPEVAQAALSNLNSKLELSLERLDPHGRTLRKPTPASTRNKPGRPISETYQYRFVDDVQPESGDQPSL